MSDRTHGTPLKPVYERWRIDEVWTQAMAANALYYNSLTATATGTYKSTSYTVCDGADFLYTLLERYGDYAFDMRIDNGYAPLPPMDAENAFLQIYGWWADLHLMDYIRMLIASTSDYDPIYNVEEHTTDKMLHGHAITKTQTGADTHDRTDYIYGLDSGTDGEKANRYHSEDLNGSHADTHSGTDTRTIDRSGNIGVTSSQELINQEYELRKKSVAQKWIKHFVDDCLILSTKEGVVTIYDD